MEELSLEQAYRIVQVHFSEPGGLMHQIEKGADINNEHIHQLERAMKTIEYDWRDLQVVPKKIVQLLYSAFPRLEECMQSYPAKEDALNTLSSQFSQWIDQIFAEEPLSEEAAIAIVHQQIVGFQPLALDLRQRRQMKEIEVSLDVFYMALERLAVIWKAKEDISKLAAGSLIMAQEVFITLAGIYRGEEQRTFQQARQQVVRRIDQCFQ